MPKISKNALVSYSAKQMYDLVNDVDAYDHFLPGCRQSEILEQSETHMKARMLLNKAGVEQELVTLNTLEPGRRIDMRLAQGPFKSLEGGWRFTPLSDEACKIELELDFTFSSRLVEFAFGKVFKSLTNNMVKAFTERAKKVYG
uniref:type II toxin-antitoxin system RatA family toxin n=1 Tax=Ningiella ruwaisensis TaxID=2364274 RepID=UPI00109F56E3|nr:type II toxin-antitoxin system RatA family toxin [Ningiella ruwaisensis]